MNKLVAISASVAAVLAIAGGVALAQDSDRSNDSGSAQGQQAPGLPQGAPPPPGVGYPGGPAGGQPGEVVSVSEDEITVRDLSGEETTIPVDDETQVLVGPGEEGNLDDLSEGDRVVVQRSDDEGAADAIKVCPEDGQRPPMGPPPSGEQGQNAPQGQQAPGSFQPAPDATQSLPTV